MAVILPKVESLTIHGFRKIFTCENFKINLSNNLNILLGGNGLGKTTLLQCVIYALTGGTDDANIEENRSLRWNHTYFKGKIDDDAYVIVEFFLGENLVSFKRGFHSTKILDCTISIPGEDKVSCTIEQAVCEYGNYKSVEDFSFLINRLLYLPESRRSLLWDHDAQIRALMIINNEFIVEEEYRILRQVIKEKDSNKRKIHWDIGRIEKRKSLIAKVSTDSDEKKNPKENYNIYVKQKNEILKNLQKVTDVNKRLYQQIKKDEDARHKLAINISEIAKQIQVHEAAHMILCWQI